MLHFNSLRATFATTSGIYKCMRIFVWNPCLPVRIKPYICMYWIVPTVMLIYVYVIQYPRYWTKSHVRLMYSQRIHRLSLFPFFQFQIFDHMSVWNDLYTYYFHQMTYIETKYKYMYLYVFKNNICNLKTRYDFINFLLT